MGVRRRRGLKKSQDAAPCIGKLLGSPMTRPDAPKQRLKPQTTQTSVMMPMHLRARGRGRGAAGASMAFGFCYWRYGVRLTSRTGAHVPDAVGYT